MEPKSTRAYQNVRGYSFMRFMILQPWTKTSVLPCGEERLTCAVNDHVTFRRKCWGASFGAIKTFNPLSALLAPTRGEENTGALSWTGS